MTTRLHIGNEFCNSFEQLQDFIRLLPNATEVYSDVLEYGRSGDLSNWLREHDKGSFAKEIDDIDVNISDRGFINKLSLIISNKTSIIRKTNYHTCFNLKVELCRTKGNELLILFHIIPIKDINEDFEMKAVCGLNTKILTFNPSKYDIGLETKNYIVFESEAINPHDSVIVYIDEEQIYEDRLKDYYFNAQYEFLNKRIYIGSLSGTPLDELISHYFKIKPVYNTTQITENNFAIDEFLKTIYDITGFDFDASTIEGKTMDKANDYLSDEIILREKNNWNSFKKTIGVNDKINILSFGIKDLLNTVYSCSQSKDIKPWDAIGSTNFDIKGLVQMLSTKYGMFFSDVEIKKQNRIDNLLKYIINKSQSKSSKPYTMEEVIKALEDYTRNNSVIERIPSRSFSSKSEVFDYIKSFSKRPFSLKNTDDISETVDWYDLYANLIRDYEIELKTKDGTIKDMVNSIWNAYK